MACNRSDRVPVPSIGLIDHYVLLLALLGSHLCYVKKPRLACRIMSSHVSQSKSFKLPYVRQLSQDQQSNRQLTTDA